MVPEDYVAEIEQAIRLTTWFGTWGHGRATAGGASSSRP